MEEGLLTLMSKEKVDPERSHLPIILLGDRVALKFIKPDEKIEGSEFLKSSEAVEKFSKGKVMAIGPGKEHFPTDHLNLDMIVSYHHGQALEIFIKGIPYQFIRASDIFAIL